MQSMQAQLLSSLKQSLEPPVSTDMQTAPPAESPGPVPHAVASEPSRRSVRVKRGRRWRVRASGIATLALSSSKSPSARIKNSAKERTCCPESQLISDRCDVFSRQTCFLYFGRPDETTPATRSRMNKLYTSGGIWKLPISNEDDARTVRDVFTQTVAKPCVAE